MLQPGATLSSVAISLGSNLQIDVEAVGPIIQKLDQAGVSLYRECKDIWYRAENVEVGQRELIVQDADGYLVRLVERLGERPACSI